MVFVINFIDTIRNGVEAGFDVDVIFGTNLKEPKALRRCVLLAHLVADLLIWHVALVG